MKEGLSHPLDLLVVMMIDLSTVIEHVANIRDRETHLVNGLGHLLVGAIPVSTHGILEMLFKWVNITETVADIGHTVEIKGSNEETFDNTGDFHGFMRVSSS
jgi:hypothetical protein